MADHLILRVIVHHQLLYKAMNSIDSAAIRHTSSFMFIIHKKKVHMISNCV